MACGKQCLSKTMKGFLAAVTGVEMSVDTPPRVVSACVWNLDPQFTSVLPPEQRFPVIDEERGLVFGVTLLHYLKTPNQSVMYVSEMFKAVG